MNHCILVTPRSLSKEGHPALARLTDAGYSLVFPSPGVQPSEEELLTLVPHCVGYLAGVERVTARVLEAAVKLRVISRNGSGVDNVDLEAAQRRSIAVLRADGANARGVAELAIGLIFALLRSIPLSDARIKQGRWERNKGIEVCGRTLGLIGCGRIGKYVAQMALGLGMKVLAYDPIPDPAFNPGSGFRMTTLDEVIANADILSLHCPPSAAGPLVNDAFLARCKKGVYLVNTARGELLDDEAVIAALNAGRVAGLAIDAFRTEPPPRNALVTHPNTIATPHIGAFTAESVDRATEVAVDNLLRFFRDNPV